MMLVEYGGRGYQQGLEGHPEAASVRDSGKPGWPRPGAGGQRQGREARASRGGQGTQGGASAKPATTWVGFAPSRSTA